MFLGKSVLKICSKFTGKHQCWSLISIKLLCNFIETTLWHGCSLVHLLQMFRTSFYNYISEGCFCIIGKEVSIDESTSGYKPFKINIYFFTLQTAFLNFFVFLCPEAAIGGVPWKKVFLKTSQNWQEKASVGVSFLIKLQASSLPATLFKKETRTQMYSWEIR